MSVLAQAPVRCQLEKGGRACAAVVPVQHVLMAPLPGPPQRLPTSP